MCAVELISLSSVNSYMLRGVFQEERSSWAGDLKWDYSEAQRIIAEMIDRRELPGHAAVVESHLVGYSYYLCRRNQGWLGNCFVTARLSGLGVEERLLHANIELIWRNQNVGRIEAQLIDLRKSRPVAVLQRLAFKSYERCFLIRRVEPIESLPLPVGVDISKWDDTALDAAAELTAHAYKGTTDWEMALYYRSPSDCLDFLSGVVFRPGCGNLLREASYCLWTKGSRRLVGYILTSVISTNNGHIPQVAVLPGFQGQGLGTVLVGRAIQALSEIDCQSVSLTVTCANRKALDLYRRLGFVPLFSFDSFVWERTGH